MATSDSLEHLVVLVLPPSSMGRAYLAFKVRSEAEIQAWRNKTPEERLAYGCSMTDFAREMDPEGFALAVERRWKEPGRAS